MAGRPSFQDEYVKAYRTMLLARLLGRPSGGIEWKLSPWEAPANVTQTEGDWVRAGLQRRPEVQARLWELSALGDEAALARWAALEGTQLGAEAEKDVHWSVGPAVSLPLPLFDLGGAKRAKIEAEVIGARHELAQVRRQVIEDVRKAFTTFNLAQAALTRMRDVLSPLQVQRRALAEAAYRAGEADLTTLLLAEQDLQETQQKVIELREKAYLAYLQLLKAAGGAGAAHN